MRQERKKTQHNHSCCYGIVFLFFFWLVFFYPAPEVSFTWYKVEKWDFVGMSMETCNKIKPCLKRHRKRTVVVRSGHFKNNIFRSPLAAKASFTWKDENWKACQSRTDPEKKGAGFEKTPGSRQLRFEVAINQLLSGDPCPLWKIKLPKAIFIYKDQIW